MTALRVAFVVAVAALLVAPASGATRLLITPSQSGKTFHLAKGRTASLRLPGRWNWTAPTVSSKAIELTPVAFFRDPGYSEWTVTARGKGRAVVRSTGSPACVHCTVGLRTLRVTLVVP
jgi:hypothetical protein